jgi:methylglutaconyl-CoA hydratase
MSLVETSTRDGVMTITLADERRRNALSPDVMTDLFAACDAAEADDAVRVVVITNRGSTFCAGANLSQRLAGERPATPAPTGPQLFGRFAHSPKPYVGRIAGHAVAGGMGLVAALDITIAAEDAKFGFTEVRVGVAPAVISVVCLPKLRAADARSLFLRGNRVSAHEAARVGLVNAAVPRDRLDAEVEDVVNDLLAGGSEAIAATKRLLREVPGAAAQDSFAWTAALSSELFAGAQAREGMAAFKEKRPAGWIPANRWSYA